MERQLLESSSTLSSDVGALWLFLGSCLVFFMQAGFSLLEAGTIRAKNTNNIILKNMVDACLGAIVWYLWGYALAYGTNNEFIGGNKYIALHDGVDAIKEGDGMYYSSWMFQWAFAATAATIVSGAVAERCQFIAYLVYTVVLTGLIYPIVVHWGWSSTGWLSPFREDQDGDGDYDPIIGGQGLIDFAGSGIVHMVGGGAALMGSYIIGPRIGRYDTSGDLDKIESHSTLLASLGTMILWFGWYGFNSVSTLCVEGCMGTASKVAVTTTLAAAAGGLSTLAIDSHTTKQLHIPSLINGILGGLVSITGSCAVVEPYAALMIGAIGGVIVYVSSAYLKKIKIDDPLDAAPIHLFCGIWGLISSGLFATKYNVLQVYGMSKTDWGLFYGGGVKQLGIQLVSALVITVWTCLTSGIMFKILNDKKLLRISQQEEEQGLDQSHHGGKAFNL
tara:strand:+ start:5706 stop:7046 length:1341 start_codon:yes stop_codon:yes gene_type:complete